MNPILKTLNDLSYVLECVALTYTGEAKTELSSLCERLESDEQYAFEGKEEILSELREALEFYYSGLEQYPKGASVLSRVNRKLWNRAGLK